MWSSKIILALAAVLALADPSQAGAATKGVVPNVKVSMPEIKKAAPAFVKKPAKSTPIKVSKSTTVAFGMLLASTAGLMNGACLSGLVSGTGVATTAVTGALTSAGTGFPKSIVPIKCLLSYIGGSAIAGALVPRPVAFELSGSYALSFVAAAAACVIATMKAKAGDSSFVFYSLAAAGIQNSLTSVFSANLCRTAHFSGTTSDIGTLLGQLVRGNTESLPKFKVLCMLFLSFFGGAYISQPIGKAYAQDTLMIAAGIYLAVASTIAFSTKPKTA